MKVSVSNLWLIYVVVFVLVLLILSLFFKQSSGFFSLISSKLFIAAFLAGTVAYLFSLFATKIDDLCEKDAKSLTTLWYTIFIVAVLAFIYWLWERSASKKGRADRAEGECDESSSESSESEGEEKECEVKSKKMEQHAKNSKMKSTENYKVKYLA